MRNFYVDAIQQFNKLNPGVEIVPEFIGFSDAYPKIQAGIQAGTPPDIVHSDAPAYAVLLQEGLVIPVTGIIKDLGWDKDLLPNLRVTMPDGNIYLLPTWIEPCFFYYRKDWAQEKGISTPLRSWDEVVAAAKAFTDPSRGRWGIALPLKRSGRLGFDFYAILAGLGGHLYNPDKTPAVKTQIFRDTLNIVKRLVEYAPPDAIEWEYSGVRTGFKTGRVGLHIYQGRTMSEILGEPFGTYGSGFPQLIDVTGMQLLPPLNSKDWPRKAIVAVGIEGFTILKTSPYHREAASFLTWLMGDRRRYIKMLNTVPFMEAPVLASVVEDPVYWDNPAYKRRPDAAATLKEAVHQAGRGPEINIYMDFYQKQGLLIPESATAQGSLVLDDAILSYVLENKPIDQVLDALQEKLAKLVRGSK